MIKDKLHACPIWRTLLTDLISLIFMYWDYSYCVLCFVKPSVTDRCSNFSVVSVFLYFAIGYFYGRLSLGTL